MTNWPQSLTEAQGKPDSSMCLFQGHTCNSNCLLVCSHRGLCVSNSATTSKSSQIDPGVIDSHTRLCMSFRRATLSEGQEEESAMDLTLRKTSRRINYIQTIDYLNKAKLIVKGECRDNNCFNVGRVGKLIASDLL